MEFYQPVQNPTVKSFGPSGNGAKSDAVIQIELQDNLTAVVPGSIRLSLNGQTVHLDLWHAEYDVRLGLTLIVVLLGGALLGGLVVTAGVVWPLRRQMRRTGNAGSGPEPTLPAPGDSP
jgi:hypothetical protein